MRFAVAAAGLAAVANAAQWNYGSYAPPVNETTAAPVYTTEVVTEYTTYCPSPTSIEHGGVTYTVTEATTLTITNCPCTVTKPVYSSVVTECSTWYNRTCVSADLIRNTDSSNSAPPPAPTYPASTPISPVYPTSVPAPPYPAPNNTSPVAPVYPPATGTVSVTTPPAGSQTSPIAPGYTGAANKASFGAAGLFVAGLLAAL